VKLSFKECEKCDAYPELVNNIVRLPEDKPVDSLCSVCKRYKELREYIDKGYKRQRELTITNPKQGGWPMGCDDRYNFKDVLSVKEAAIYLLDKAEYSQTAIASVVGISQPMVIKKLVKIRYKINT